MKKIKLSRILFVCCNTVLILMALLSIIYSLVSLILSYNESKSVFKSVNKDYEACFGKKYAHEDTYFTDITCMKMEITSSIITKSGDLKDQYYKKTDAGTGTDSSSGPGISNDSKAETITALKDNLSDMQDYNKAIPYKKQSLLLLNQSNSLYSALNYMVYGNDALLKDTVNFIDEKEALSLVTNKDIQEIHVMANMSKNIVLNLNKQFYFYIYIILTSLFLLLGTCINIYRINARKKKYRRKKNIIQRNKENKAV